MLAPGGRGNGHPRHSGGDLPAERLCEHALFARLWSNGGRRLSLAESSSVQELCNLPQPGRVRAHAWDLKRHWVWAPQERPSKFTSNIRDRGSFIIRCLAFKSKKRRAKKCEPPEVAVQTCKSPLNARDFP